MSDPDNALELKVATGQELDWIGAGVDVLRFVESDDSLRDRIASAKIDSIYYRYGILSTEERDASRRQNLRRALKYALELLA